MPEIYLPQKIAFGNNSLKLNLFDAYNSLLIISDTEYPNCKFFENNSKQVCSKIIAQMYKIVNPNISELYDKSIKFISDNTPGLIIAIGSAEIIDLGMVLSYQSGIEFSAIPTGCASGMSDFENCEYSVYRKSPSIAVLDPRLIYGIGSGAVAYDALASFAYAIDTLLSCDNNLIYEMAVNGAAGILDTVVASFRGDVVALEKLMYSMYYCVIAHRNMKNYGTSVLDSVTKFFAQFGYSKKSLAVLCIPNIMEHYICKPFAEIMRKSSIISYHQNDETLAMELVEKVRNLQASMSVPRSVRGYGADESLYVELAEKSKIQRELLDKCFYGSFKFMKM